MSIQVYDKNGQPYEADLVDGEQYRQLERENAALRKDKERLDYLETSIDFVGWRFYGKPCHFDLRSTIDVKRKEIQT